MPGRVAAPLPDGLPLRLRAQFAVTRRITPVLAVLGLREPAIRLRGRLLRARRQVFERFGSARFSRPALHEMDQKLDRILDRDCGYFVEAGGHDGFTQSNTYYLERFRNWRGLLVEPMRELADEARRNRPRTRVVECALVGTDHPEPYVEMYFGDLFSTVESDQGGNETWAAHGLVLGWREPRRERVPARSLSSILDEVAADRVDLLSLDVEGYEAEVLSGIDFDRHAPAWILVEMHDLAEGRGRIGKLLGDRYVEHAQLSPLDVLYHRAEVTANASTEVTSNASTPVSASVPLALPEAPG